MNTDATATVTHTTEDVTKATKEAFVDRETVMRPAVNGMKPNAEATATPATETKPTPEATQQQPANTPAPATSALEEKPAPTAFNVDEMSDDERDALMAKLTKGKVKKISDLTPAAQKTKEEIAQEEEQEKTDALNWMFSTGKSTSTDYASALVVKSKENRDIALALFGEELKELNVKITDEEVLEQFRDYYLEDSDEDTTGRKLRVKEMNRLAENYKKEKAGFLDNILPEYKEFKNKDANKELIGQRIDEAFEVFIPKIAAKATYTSADDKETTFDIDFTLEDSEVKAVKKEVRKSMVSMLSTLGVEAKDIDPNLINKEIDSVLKSRQFDKAISYFASEAAKKAKMDTEAFHKAIPVRQPNFTTTTQSTQANKFREFSAEERAAMHGQN